MTKADEVRERSARPKKLIYDLRVVSAQALGALKAPDQGWDREWTWCTRRRWLRNTVAECASGLDPLAVRRAHKAAAPDGVSASLEQSGPRRSGRIPELAKPRIHEQ